MQPKDGSALQYTVKYTVSGKTEKKVAGELIVPASVDPSTQWQFEVQVKTGKGLNYYSKPDGDSEVKAGKDFAPKKALVVVKQRKGDWVRTHENKWLPIKLKGAGVLKEIGRPEGARSDDSSDEDTPRRKSKGDHSDSDSAEETKAESKTSTKSKGGGEGKANAGNRSYKVGERVEANFNKQGGWLVCDVQDLHASIRLPCDWMDALLQCELAPLQSCRSLSVTLFDFSRSLIFPDRLLWC